MTHCDAHMSAVEVVPRVREVAADPLQHQARAFERRVGWVRNAQ